MRRAGGNGLLTVVTALLADLDGGGRGDLRRAHRPRGAGDAGHVPATRRAAVERAAAVRSAPLLVTTSFVFIILGVQQGSPVVVQTMVATTPLFVLAAES